MTPVIAIDGPAGSGKGTMARRLASHFGFAYLDTGMMYRATAYLNLSAAELSKLSIADFMKAVSKIHDADLRTDEISLKTSTLSKQLEIRENMTRLQREFAAHPGGKYRGAILDGRDIGTVVVPDAACKLFVTADVKVRAERRFASIKQTNKQATFDEVYENLKKRDEQDSSRNVAPLKCDSSYVIVDTSGETVGETFAKIVKIAEKALSVSGVKI